MWVLEKIFGSLVLDLFGEAASAFLLGVERIWLYG